MEKGIVLFIGVPILVSLLFILMRALPPKNTVTKKAGWSHVIKLLIIQGLIGMTSVIIGVKMAGLVGYMYALITFVLAAVIFNVCYGIWYFKQIIKSQNN